MKRRFSEATLHLKKIEGHHKNKIRKHWKSTVVFTDAWSSSTHEHQLKEEELLPGELSAAIFTVGCYTVRSAQRVYKVPEENTGYSSKNEVPADQSELARLREREKERKKGIYRAIGIEDTNNRLRMTHEISAKHNSDPEGVFKDMFKYVCRASHSISIRRAWHEQIECICTIKENPSLPDEHASLFVLNVYIGDSFSVETWYKLNPHGEVTNFSIHPYDSEDSDKLWENGEDILWYCISKGICVPFKKNGKCGYAYYDTDVVMIEPQWDAALPFGAYECAIVINGIPIEEILTAINGSVTSIQTNHNLIPESIAENFNYKAGLINENGEIVLPVIFDTIGYFDNDYVCVKFNGKWGVLGLDCERGTLGLNGKTVLPIEYDEISIYASIYIFAQKDGKWAIFERTGEMIVDLILTERPNPDSFTGHYMLIQKGKEYGIVNLMDGKIVQQPTMTKKEATAMIEKLEIESVPQ